MLFAAGLGTRMAPLTKALPKPMVEVAGTPLFDHALSVLRGHRFDRIVANTHYLAPILSAHLAKCGVLESHEPTLLDTGGGLKHALPLLDSAAVVTMNTDAVWTGAPPLLAMLNAWDPDEMDGLLCLVPQPRATAHLGTGDFDLLENGTIRRGNQTVYTGLQIIKTEPFSRYSETVFSMNRVWQGMLHEQRVFGLLHTGGWADVGRPEALPLAEALLAQSRV